MKNSFLLLSIFIGLQSQLIAQELPLEAYESFDNNVRLWYIDKNEDYSFSLENSKYVLRVFKKEGGAYCTYSPYVDTTADFSIETSFTQISGDNNKGFGIFWGYNDFRKEKNIFCVSSTGYFRLSRNGPEYTDLVPWTKHAAIKPLGEVNVLKIERKGNKMNYYINAQLVYTGSLLPMHGTMMGFINYGHMELHIDDLYFRQKTSPVKLSSELPAGLVKENMGPNINSPYHEVAPKISYDGKLLYFDVKECPDNLGEGSEKKTDIWYSTSIDGKTWSKRQNPGRPLNNEGNNSPINLSADNNTIMLLNQYFKDKSNTKGFSISHREGQDWLFPENLVMEDFYNEINLQEGHLSADGKALLFSAVRKDTRNYPTGSPDLYVSFKKNNNTWSAPINLGNSINTIGREMCPFLAADGVTLFFSSNGYKGFGGHDVFVSKRLDDTWTKWSAPKNLGKDINDIGFDGYFTLPASGEYAYVVSSVNSLGKDDIFRIKLPQTQKAVDPVIIVYGNVYDAKTKQPIGANIRYEKLDQGKEAGQARSNKSTGAYKIVLPYGNHFGFRAQADGYISVNENLDITQTGLYTEVQKDLYLVPIEIGQSIQLKNVFFKQSLPELLPTSSPELDRLTQILKDNPTICIELSGHTDNQGDESKNIKLSNDRVQAVKAYLVNRGIAAERITGKGYGSSRPIASNATEATRKQNRRVEFTITKK